MTTGLTKSSLDRSADWANAAVLACYHGDGPNGDGIHLMGPLARKVLRIAPPLVITETQAREVMELMERSLAPFAETSRSHSPNERVSAAR